MDTQTDQQRILQLTSSYSPAQSPQLPLTFGDYLSLLWRIDRSAGERQRELYYRQCAEAVATGLRFDDRSMYRLVGRTRAGEICGLLSNAPYQGTGRFVDAQDRREAINYLIDLRGHILSMSAYRQHWTVGWPGSRIADDELRERLFAVFFTAFEGQLRPFSRLILVIDIVLQELLLGTREASLISLIRLIREFGYPDPDSVSARDAFVD